MKKSTYPISLLVKTSHKTLEDLQNDKKKIENFGTSKYQNKRPSKFSEEKQIPYPPPL
jgi:hemerythrin superfamily protein